MPYGVKGLEFEVWGLGFWVLGLGFRVWGLGFGVWGLGFGVLGLIGLGDLSVGLCEGEPAWRRNSLAAHMGSVQGKPRFQSRRNITSWGLGSKLLLSPTIFLASTCRAYDDASRLSPGWSSGIRAVFLSIVFWSFVATFHFLTLNSLCYLPCW